MSPNEENVSQFLLCVNHTYSELVQDSQIIKARSIENKTQYASRGQVPGNRNSKSYTHLPKSCWTKQNAMQHCANKNGIL
jgi:hypothetical protein